jgi:hypothetical protein
MIAALVQLAYNPNNIKPGWVAFVLVLALCVATFFLWRSMNTQLGRIRLPQNDKAARVDDGSVPADGDPATDPASQEGAANERASDDSAPDDGGERPTDPS